MDFTNDAAARHDAQQEALDRRVQAARVTLGTNLEKLATDGHTVFFGEDGDGFSIDVENGVYVDCDGFDGGDPTFLVVLADGAERLVQYDVSQMARFADRIEAYEHIAADPLGWCRDAADTAKGMADAA